MSDQGKHCAPTLPPPGIEGLHLAMKHLGAAVHEAGRVESLAMQLVIVMGPRVSVGFDEVKRREQVFVDAAASGTHSPGSPRVAALESVLDDVRVGRLQ